MTEENIRPTLKSTNSRIDIIHENLGYLETKVKRQSDIMDSLCSRTVIIDSKLQGLLSWLNALYGIVAAFCILVGFFGYFDGLPPYVLVSCAICGIICIVGCIQTDKLRKGF